MPSFAACRSNAPWSVRMACTVASSNGVVTSEPTFLTESGSYFNRLSASAICMSGCLPARCTSLYQNMDIHSANRAIRMLDSADFRMNSALA